MQKTLRVYYRPGLRCSLKAQKTQDAKWDGTIIPYIEGDRRPGDAFPMRDKWIGAQRGSEIVGIPFYHLLATGSEELKAVRAELKARKIVILELSTGRRSDCASALGDMVQEALDFYARRGLTTAMAKRLGRKGAAKSPVTKSKRDERCPNDVAEAILNDHKTYPTLPLALAAINKVKDANGKKFKRKWNIAYMYREASRPGGIKLKPRQ